jgi:hypothetical protein
LWAIQAWTTDIWAQFAGVTLLLGKKWSIARGSICPVIRTCHEHGLKNRSKIREIRSDRFYRFLVNRSVNLKFLNKLKNFEIKKSKKN